MFRTASRLLLAPAVCLLASLTAPVSHAEYHPLLALLPGHGPVVPLKNASMIEKTPGGLRYVAGQQDSHLTITEVDGGLLFADTGTRELRKLPGECSPVAAEAGVAALCSIPQKFVDVSEMYIEVWPRLGNDYVDGSSLSGKYRLWVLADRGRDRVMTGAGRDFVNGAQNRDRVWGGAGDDWIRTGRGPDVLWGEEGNDKLVGVQDDDEIHGGAGDDRVGGGPGSDKLWADEGSDVVACGGGPDTAYVDESDRSSECESKLSPITSPRTPAAR